MLSEDRQISAFGLDLTIQAEQKVLSGDRQISAFDLDLTIQTEQKLRLTVYETRWNVSTNNSRLLTSKASTTPPSPQLKVTNSGSECRS